MYSIFIFVQVAVMHWCIGVRSFWYGHINAFRSYPRGRGNPMSSSLMRGLKPRLHGDKFHCVPGACMSPFASRDWGPSYTIPDSYRSDINLRCFPVLSAITTFHIWSFCLIMLYYHNFKCQIHLDRSSKIWWRSDANPVSCHWGLSLMM
jgi:hypothetical protein